MSLAVFISPHGFGHAARACALIQVIAERREGLRFEIFTTVPKWFFEDSLEVPFTWHQLDTDVGLVQKSSLEVDLGATVERVGELVGSLESRAGFLARTLEGLSCRAVLADISPLGLAAAAAAGLPSVLVENFTWEWIYAAYFDREPRLRPLAASLGERFRRATLRLRARPVCPPAVADDLISQRVLEVPPICRLRRRTRGAVRRELGLDPARPLVLLTMGGVAWRYANLDRLGSRPDLNFAVLAGVAAAERRDNVLLLPDRSPVPVSDLVAGADVVVGKLGYSTVVEAWAAGTRYAFVRRPDFPESPVLEAFVRETLPAVEIPVSELERGEWLGALDALLARPRASARAADGAERAAEAILRLS